MGAQGEVGAAAVDDVGEVAVAVGPERAQEALARARGQGRPLPGPCRLPGGARQVRPDDERAVPERLDLDREAARARWRRRRCGEAQRVGAGSSWPRRPSAETPTPRRVPARYPSRIASSAPCSLDRMNSWSPVASRKRSTVTTHQRPASSASPPLGSSLGRGPTRGPSTCAVRARRSARASSWRPVARHRPGSAMSASRADFMPEGYPDTIARGPRRARAR